MCGGFLAPVSAVGGLAAAPFTGGASLGVLVATGAATGLVTSAVTGGNPITGAITGSFTGSFGGSVGGAIAASATSATFINQQAQAKAQARQAAAQMQASIDYHNSMIAKTRAQVAKNEQPYATETLNRVVASRNKIIFADRKEVLKKVFTVEKYSMEHSQQNDFDPLNRDPNNVRQQELIQQV